MPILIKQKIAAALRTFSMDAIWIWANMGLIVRNRWYKNFWTIWQKTTIQIPVRRSCRVLFLMAIFQNTNQLWKSKARLNKKRKLGTILRSWWIRPWMILESRYLVCRFCHHLATMICSITIKCHVFIRKPPSGFIVNCLSCGSPTDRNKLWICRPAIR